MLIFTREKTFLNWSKNIANKIRLRSVTIFAGNGGKWLMIPVVSIIRLNRALSSADWQNMSLITASAGWLGRRAPWNWSRRCAPDISRAGRYLNLPEMVICNCCWVCCGVLGSYNRASLPLHFQSHYLAIISTLEDCTGCGKCVKYCPVQALTLENKKVVLDEKLCIGCGQCEIKCADGVMKLTYPFKNLG